MRWVLAAAEIRRAWPIEVKVKTIAAQVYDARRAAIVKHYHYRRAGQILIVANVIHQYRPSSP